MFIEITSYLASIGGAVSVEGMARPDLNLIDWLIMGIYLAFVLGIGFALKKYMNSADDFFLSGRSIPGWVCGLAFISANLGAQELIGMAASGAEYGIMTSHFYWVGAIPAMVFLGVFMMPMYYGSRAKSVPEYLKMRYNEPTRVFNSVSFAFMTVASSGISMHALADLLHALLGWDYYFSLVITSVIVLAYVLKGGLSSAIYNEVLQFFMIVFGIAPLAYIALKDVGGWQGLIGKLQASEQGQGALHSWAQTGGTDNPMGVPWYGILLGLGFVLSFGYWTTNFAEVQRALAANSMGAARRTPIIGAIPKMLFPAVVILPGMIAYGLTSDAVAGGYSIPLKDGVPNYNQVLPSMIFHYFPNGLLGLALTALMASFMSGMAANVTAFNTVWTYDLYKTMKPNQTDAQLLTMGKLATIFGIIAAMGFALVASKYNNIMSVLQLVFGFVNAPLFATFLLGMFTTRSNGTGSFWGLVVGTASAVTFHGLSYAIGNPPGVKGGWISQSIDFPKEMSQNFWIAIVAFSATFLINAGLSLVTKRSKTDEELRGLVYSLTPKHRDENEHWIFRPAVLGSIVMVAVVILNLIFW
ncbi:MAG: Na+/galactose cotransporter [Verrucomicrobia bacterium]|nr:MAG: Na+/galactose cotransporter [Verrucomicrobiota bacterium]TAE87863.1 MAG: Na+/galactose cotransporter [Verrucomicrobiota bacterium]TAF25606.1 MAG: Na+/galactose cotransporter [Verrucomicrobiota bacterium]TAF41327.1 MAG: Na+/galactose cotransporter [Verrucomicrobiota bacterium]